jgi:hypothetical protein
MLVRADAARAGRSVRGLRHPAAPVVTRITARALRGVACETASPPQLGQDRLAEELVILGHARQLDPNV